MSMIIPERIERKYEPYPESRDSGVEWLAKVPTQWNIIRLKYGVSLINDKVENGESDTPYLGLENVESWTGRIIETDFKPEIEGASNSFRKDDVLFGKLRPYLAKAVHAQYHGICTSELMVLRPQKYYSRFLFYYMLSPSTVNIIDSSTYGVKMPRANWHFIGNLPFVVPPIQEQQTIADFLDRETARIDELIAKKQRLIDLLQEQRTALITRTVTKGLNQNVHMKDSGVEWLGEIPAHWEIKRFRFLFSLSKGKNPEVLIQFELDNAQPYVTMNYIRTGLLESYGYPNHNTLMVDDGDLALLWDGSKSGEFVLCRQGILGSTLTKCNYTRVIDRRFAYYACKTIERHLQAMTIGMGIPHVDRDSLNNMLLPLLKINEQQCIADYLDRETSRIDSLIGRIKQVIEKLQEYRSALITAAVTGKIDVREQVS